MKRRKLFGRTIAQTAVRTQLVVMLAPGRDLVLFEQLAQPLIVERLPALGDEHDRTAAIAERAGRIENLQDTAHSDTRCSRLAFMRIAGIVHTPSSRSISLHTAPRTTTERGAFSTRNSNASSRSKSLKSRPDRTNPPGDGNAHSEPIEFSPPSTRISMARADNGTRYSRLCSIRSTETLHFLDSRSMSARHRGVKLTFL